MVLKIGVFENKCFLLCFGYMFECFVFLLFIVVGEGFFKLVIILLEKGIYKVDFFVLVNFMFGGIVVFV